MSHDKVNAIFKEDEKFRANERANLESIHKKMIDEPKIRNDLLSFVHNQPFTLGRLFQTYPNNCVNVNSFIEQHNLSDSKLKFNINSNIECVTNVSTVIDRENRTMTHNIFLIN